MQAGDVVVAAHVEKSVLGVVTNPRCGDPSTFLVSARTGQRNRSHGEPVYLSHRQAKCFQRAHGVWVATVGLDWRHDPRLLAVLRGQIRDVSNVVPSVAPGIGDVASRRTKKPTASRRIEEATARQQLVAVFVKAADAGDRECVAICLVVGRGPEVTVSRVAMPMSERSSAPRIARVPIQLVMRHALPAVEEIRLSLAGVLPFPVALGGDQHRSMGLFDELPILEVTRFQQRALVQFDAIGKN